MKVACMIAVEICFDIKLIIAKQLVLTYSSEKQASSGRGCIKTFHFSRVGIHRNEIGRESRRRDGTVPVIIGPHPHGSAYSHGKCGVTAHEQEVGCVRILKMMKLVIIKILDQGLDGIGVRF